MADKQIDLSFRELSPDELDYVFIETTDRGPFVEDVFYQIVAGNRGWRVPSSQFPSDWLTALPNVDTEAIIQAHLSASNAYFLAWAREPDLAISPKRRAELAARAEALLLKLFTISPATSKSIVDSIISQYSLPSRHYHGLRHIAQCLKELDSLKDESLDKDAIELAIWYHDVVYFAGSSKNEEQSAQKLKDDLSPFEAKVSIAKIIQMILATKDHAVTADNDTKALLDIDLSILGRGYHDYESYRYGVRKEFGAYSRFKFNFGRKRFLKKLLAGPIFQSASMRTKYEGHARKNIERELQSLESSWLVGVTNLARSFASWFR